ncbi:protein NDRG3-like isoform X3 [Lineus longissimus]|uniref:protein NDRG3-like isoform X3 n=1 Tax=Lineus longissimus TaxID=88925 RepID=UPI00315DD84D
MAEKLTEIELAGIQLEESKPRTLAKDPSYNILQEDDIDTAVGVLHVAVQGDRSKPAILTYHDLGLNHMTCFQGFFNFADMQPLLRHFCVYHVNAPGQQEGAIPLTHSEKKDEREVLLAEHSSTESPKRNSLPATWTESILSRAGYSYGNTSPQQQQSPAKPVVNEKKSLPRFSLHSTPTSPVVDGTGYPTMDQLGEMILPVLQYYGLKRVIGFGVGAGANILCRFALQHPEKCDALFLVNCTATAAGWTEWGYQKLNSWYLKMGVITATTEEYLLWHWFGKEAKERNTDLVHVFKDNIKQINPHNMASFIDAYVQRTDLGISRELDLTKKKDAKTLKCNVMLVGSAGSPHLDDVVAMNSRLDPSNSNVLNISDCSGMVLEEQPAKVAEAFRLFLQGMGHVPSLSQTKIVAERDAARRNSTPFDSPARKPGMEATATVC